MRNWEFRKAAGDDGKGACYTGISVKARAQLAQRHTQSAKDENEEERKDMDSGVVNTTSPSCTTFWFRGNILPSVQLCLKDLKG
jgi:hypothetical protein